MRKISAGDRIFDAVNYVLLSIALVMVVYVLYYILIASVSEPAKVLTGQVALFPKGFQLESYQQVFQNPEIVSGYTNSILYAFFGTLINIALTMTAGYSLSRRDLKGRKFFMFLLSFTMFFGGGLIPTYMLVRELGMVNTFWAMIIPNAVSVWNIIITRTYFESNIPQELLEVSRIDGCSNIRFFLSIVLPLSKAIIAVMVLFYAVGHWNSYFQALIYLKDRDRYPLQMVLRNVLIASQPDATLAGMADRAKLYQKIEMLKYALVVVSSLPVLMLYPFVQKYFVQGVMIGSLKG